MSSFTGTLPVLVTMLPFVPSFFGISASIPFIKSGGFRASTMAHQHSYPVTEWLLADTVIGEGGGFYGRFLGVTARESASFAFILRHIRQHLPGLAFGSDFDLRGPLQECLIVGLLVDLVRKGKASG